MTSAHGKKGRHVIEFEGYSSKAEESMYKQMVKMIQLHYAKHPHKLSASMSKLAYNGGN